MIKPAIVAVGYNRPDGMKRLLDSIGKAKFDVTDVPLIVSIDESNRSDEVEKVARDFEWKHGTLEIRRFPERQGLRKHIVQCGDYSEKYGAVIILEDDLIVAEDFYSYTCAAHEKYGEDERICGISLYSYGTNVFTHIPFAPMPSTSDVYLNDMVVTWGQSWTALQWKKFKAWYFEHEDKLPSLNIAIPKDISSWTRSWGRYFASYMVENGLSYVHPYISRTTCFADYGEHNKSKTEFTFVQVPLMQGCPHQYRFANYEELVHYDAFYEQVLDSKQIIMGISGADICMDVNQMKTDSCGKKFVVTGEKLPFKQLASFGLSLRPITQNIIQEIPGDELYLYELPAGQTQFRKWGRTRMEMKLNLKRLKYEYRDASWRLLVSYAPKEFCRRLIDIFLEKIKR